MAPVVNSSTSVSPCIFKIFKEVSTIKQIPNKLEAVLRICGEVLFFSIIAGTFIFGWPGVYKTNFGNSSKQCDRILNPQFIFQIYQCRDKIPKVKILRNKEVRLLIRNMFW